MSYKVSFLIVLTLMVLFSAVACAPFQVVSPEPFQNSSQDFAITDDGKLEIVVTFTKDIDLSSFVVGKTVVLETEKDSNAGGTLTAVGTDGVKFTTSAEYGDLLVFDPDGFFTLHLIGTDTGDGTILSTGGAALDGDEDGSSGGDYQTTFVIVG
ncbi:MAG: hypothetical protein M9928_03085 [Anaerolineae bacterium]|nr:hypothetical protein [Anaerolineae bacterium]MCO5199337.1 hypothetical protein [Anaerolineae bacterium]MCO5203990.1 hypothetical protein [Anaerolineae bacterium]